MYRSVTIKESSKSIGNWEITLHTYVKTVVELKKIGIFLKKVILCRYEINLRNILVNDNYV